MKKLSLSDRLILLFSLLLLVILNLHYFTDWIPELLYALCQSALEILLLLHFYNSWKPLRHWWSKAFFVLLVLLVLAGIPLGLAAALR